MKNLHFLLFFIYLKISHHSCVKVIMYNCCVSLFCKMCTLVNIQYSVCIRYPRYEKINLNSSDFSHLRYLAWVCYDTCRIDEVLFIQSLLCFLNFYWGVLIVQSIIRTTLLFFKTDDWTLKGRSHYNDNVNNNYISVHIT